MEIFSIISLEAIMNLPWLYKGPALVIITFMLVRFLYALVRFRLIKAFINFVYMLIILVLISSFSPIVTALDSANEQSVETSDSEN